MTRDRIDAGLAVILATLANPDPCIPDGWEPYEWAYVKGIASGEIMRLRDRLVAGAKMHELASQKPQAPFMWPDYSARLDRGPGGESER